ncbi:FMN-binding protein [Schumannella soli]|uniref:FMN-binding protein n=1 Tax=Schumannella soli TaxID=2590779 RepID=UPI0034E21D42
MRATLGGAFAALAVLIIGWQAGTAASHPATATTASGSTGGSGTSGSAGSGTFAGSGSASGSGTSDSTTGSSSAGSGSGLKDGSYTGQSADTRFGAVQVAITVSGGSITDVQAVHLTDRDQRSVSISNRAAPVLRQEAIQAQSAQIQTVSGATYTSEGYITSLQSALDQAR